MCEIPQVSSTRPMDFFPWLAAYPSLAPTLCRSSNLAVATALLQAYRFQCKHLSEKHRKLFQWGLQVKPKSSPN
jgi:hypothetical protein